MRELSVMQEPGGYDGRCWHVQVDGLLRHLARREPGSYMSRMSQDELDRIADLRAPSLAQIEDLAWRSYEALPDEFRALCDGLVIRVDDFPDDDTLDQMGCETEFDLLGLFRGRGLAQGGAASQTGELPSMVWLYRRPILDYWCEHEEALGALVTHVLVHEIGHHFGLSDEDMHALERQAG